MFINIRLSIKNFSLKIMLEENIVCENNILTCAPISKINNGLGQEYFNCIKKAKNSIAQYIVDTNEIDIFGSLLQRTVRTAIKLDTKAQEDDIVCICTNNHLNAADPFIAAAYLNLKICTLDPTLSLMDIKLLINQVKPKIFFVINTAADLINTSVEELGLEAEIVVFGEFNNKKYSSFSEYLEPSDLEENFKPKKVKNLKETALILFSSGTTGQPKGICLNHISLLNQSNNKQYLWNHGFLDSRTIKVSLIYTSLYWVSCVGWLTSSILFGIARVICAQFDPKKCWEIIEKYKVNMIMHSPVNAIEFRKNYKKTNTSSLITLVVGGGSISPKLLKNLQELLPETFVCQVYGQTEIGGLLTLNLKCYCTDNPYFESIGKPVPGITYKVVDIKTNKICGPNQKGELRIKSDFCMNGYFNRDSSAAFDSEGWLRTGDIIYYDKDHFFYIVDRIKEMLKYRSWHVAPATLEKIILQHPAVLKAVVIGIPHEEDGDHPMAIVVLDKESKIREDEIINFVHERVDDRKKLRGGVKFVEDLPSTSHGKTNRYLVKKIILEHLDK